MTESGNCRGGDDLEEAGPDEDLKHGAGVDGVVVSFDDVSGGVDVPWKSDSEGGHGQTEGGEHGDTAVLELRLPEVGNPLGAILAELERVELRERENRR